MTAAPPSRRPLGQARFLVRVAQSLGSGKGYEADLAEVLEMVAAEVDADAMSLCVPMAQRGHQEMRVAFARRGAALETSLLDVELGLREEVRRTGKPLRIDDTRAEPRFRGSLERTFGMDPRSLVAVPVGSTAATVGILVAMREQPRPFTDEDHDLLQAVADRLAAWVENDALLRQLLIELSEREMLMAVSREVGQTLDLGKVLDRVFEVLRPVVPFDAAAIFLAASAEAELELSAQLGYEDVARIAVVPRGRGIVGLARASLAGVRIQQVSGHPDYLEVRPATQSEMAVPIVAGGQAIGVINLESDRPGFYTDRHLRAAELIATQVATAIANAQLYKSRLERLQVQHELELAREIQLSLLPDRTPATDRIEVRAVNVPSSTVGGDYYDFVKVGEDRLALVLADVSGHGLSAALLTASMRTGFRLLVRQMQDPAQIASHLGNVLFEGSPPNQYVAAVLAVLDLETGVLSYCNAGHLPPVVLSHDRDSELSGGGMPLGLFASARYESHTRQLEPGDLLAFYTDGIPESEDSQGEQLGVDRLRALLKQSYGKDLRAIIADVRSLVRKHRGRRGGHLDDITLMVARWSGPSTGSRPS